MEVGAFPELSNEGAYSTEQTYSENDVQTIISYAAVVTSCLLSSHFSSSEFLINFFLPYKARYRCCPCEQIVPVFLFLSLFPGSE